MGVVETLGIELQHPCDEGAIGLVRTCGNVGEHGADRCRHIVGPQGHARADAESSTAAAPEREEKLGSLDGVDDPYRSEEHTSELQSLMRMPRAVVCLQKRTRTQLSTP